MTAQHNDNDTSIQERSSEVSAQEGADLPVRWYQREVIFDKNIKEPSTKVLVTLFLIVIASLIVFAVAMTMSAAGHS